MWGNYLKNNPVTTPSTLTTAIRGQRDFMANVGSKIDYSSVADYDGIVTENGQTEMPMMKYYEEDDNRVEAEQVTTRGNNKDQTMYRLKRNGFYQRGPHARARTQDFPELSEHGEIHQKVKMPGRMSSLHRVQMPHSSFNQSSLMTTNDLGNIPDAFNVGGK